MFALGSDPDIREKSPSSPGEWTALFLDAADASGNVENASPLPVYLYSFAWKISWVNIFE